MCSWTDNELVGSAKPLQFILKVSIIVFLKMSFENISYGLWISLNENGMLEVYLGLLNNVISMFYNQNLLYRNTNLEYLQPTFKRNIGLVEVAGADQTH